jgi:hypothetical protein
MNASLSGLAHFNKAKKESTRIYLRRDGKWFVEMGQDGLRMRAINQGRVFPNKNANIILVLFKLPFFMLFLKENRFLWLRHSVVSSFPKVFVPRLV